MSPLLGPVRRHPRTAVMVGAGAVVALVAVLLWFQPWKLWVDDRVNEAVPGSVEAEADEPDQEQPSPADDTAHGPIRPAGPTTIASGEFRSLEHTTEGRALVLELPNGDRFLRFEDFETSNGPDLKVYLSSAPASSDDDAFNDDFVDLGTLKGNVGNQNYAIPPDVDLKEYASAVVWCRRFSVGFAVAPLT
ncbi:MAG: DM13 domain-containing protein [Actinomycetota bacterium]